MGLFPVRKIHLDNNPKGYTIRENNSLRENNTQFIHYISRGAITHDNKKP
jgi:hypothetical protein